MKGDGVKQFVMCEGHAEGQVTSLTDKITWQHCRAAHRERCTAAAGLSLARDAHPVPDATITHTGLLAAEELELPL